MMSSVPRVPTPPPGNPHPNLEGRHAIDAWISASNEVKIAEETLGKRIVDLNDAARILSKWMLPEDVKPGEKIAVWYGDSLIQVEAPPDPASGPIVTVRKRGRSLITLR